MNKHYSAWSNLKYLTSHLYNYSHSLFVCVILEIVTNALQPLTQALLPAVIISLLENKVEFTILVIVCLLVFAGVGLLNGLASYFSQRNWYQFIFARTQLFYPLIISKVINIDYSLYEGDQNQNDFEKAFSVLNSNNQGIEGYYHHATILFTSVLGLLFYSLIISNVHPLLVLLLIVLCFIQYGFFILARNYKIKHKEEQAHRGRHQWYFHQRAHDIKCAKDIRLYQAQDWLIGLYDKYNKAYKNQYAKERGYFYLYDLVGLLLQILRDGVCYGYLIYLLTKGMNVSEFVLYLGVISGFGNWFTQISDMISKMSEDQISIGYFRDYINLKNIYHHTDGKTLELKEHQSLDIVFDDVCFTYPNSNKLVLDHVSFHIHEGDNIALVGINGAGKTTLVKMLCGFYQPTSGHIYINGVDIAELNIEDYFDQVSVLFQDAIIFSYSIQENITACDFEKVNQEKFQKVLKLSGLDEKVNSLAKKEKTFIGKDIEEDGIQLSGGQIQKLYLARALYKDAPMLILDEPTAALDAIAESEMYEKYNTLTQNKTSLFISHRLSSTRFCDKIFFLENGKIKEEGTHDELMKLNGSYANMFDVQSQYYKEEGEQHEN